MSSLDFALHQIWPGDSPFFQGEAEATDQPPTTTQNERDDGGDYDDGGDIGQMETGDFIRAVEALRGLH
jgi:hypothetical protein